MVKTALWFMATMVASATLILIVGMGARTAAPCPDGVCPPNRPAEQKSAPAAVLPGPAQSSNQESGCYRQTAPAPVQETCQPRAVRTAPLGCVGVTSYQVVGDEEPVSSCGGYRYSMTPVYSVPMRSVTASYQATSYEATPAYVPGYEPCRPIRNAIHAHFARKRAMQSRAASYGGSASCYER
jgi:hypothetical protein